MAHTIKIDDDLKSRIKTLAGRKQRSEVWVMREALMQYAAREEARESFKNEAASSWAEYQRTGLHLTGEEVESWLDGWGSETEPELPECHE